MSDEIPRAAVHFSWTVPYKPMKGSPKQIAWAETIRDGLVTTLEQKWAKLSGISGRVDMSTPVPAKPPHIGPLLIITGVLRQVSSAKKWIDARDRINLGSIAGASTAMDAIHAVMELNLISKIPNDASSIGKIAMIVPPVMEARMLEIGMTPAAKAKA